jgi:hypothetical protein
VFGVSSMGGQDGWCIVRLHRSSIDVDLPEVARYDDDDDDDDLKSDGEVGVGGGKERILYILKKEWRKFKLLREEIGIRSFEESLIVRCDIQNILQNFPNSTVSEFNLV